VHDNSLRGMLRRRWAIVLLAILAALGVSGYLALRSPHYQATAVVNAPVPPNATGQALSFPDVVPTDGVMQRALSDASSGESVATLQADTAVVASRSTLYQVTVSDPSPSQAVALANAVAHEAAVLYTQLGGGAADSIVTALDADAARYRDQALAANQALQQFESANPDVVSGTAAPPLLAQHRQLQLEQQAAQNAYVSFQSDLAQARINQVSQSQSFTATIVDLAVTAHSQLRTLVLRVAFAGLIGLILGLALAIGFDYVMAGSTRRAPVVSADEGNGHYEPTSESDPDWVSAFSTGPRGRGARAGAARRPPDS